MVSLASAAFLGLLFFDGLLFFEGLLFLGGPFFLGAEFLAGVFLSAVLGFGEGVSISSVAEVFRPRPRPPRPRPPRPLPATGEFAAFFGAALAFGFLRPSVVFAISCCSSRDGAPWRE